MDLGALELMLMSTCCSIFVFAAIILTMWFGFDYRFVQKKTVKKKK